MRVLVTGAGGPLGVNITRSLKKAPEQLWLLGTEANRYHTYLSLTDQTELIPPAKKSEEYVEAISSLVDREGIDFIFPTHPIEVRTLAKYRDRFSPKMFLLPDFEIVAIADSKWETYRRLEANGLPVPKTTLLKSVTELESVFQKSQARPIWVRGAGTPGAGIGVASLPCREVTHAVSWVDYWNGWGSMIASEFLPGRNLTWTGLYRDGKLLVSQSRERLEYVLPHVSPSGITGAPAVSRTISEPDLTKLGNEAVRTICSQPVGPFFVDFKESADGAPKITEINAGRFGTTVHFYTEAGYNFPYALIRAARGDLFSPAPVNDPITPMTYWIRTLDCGPVLVKDIPSA